MNEDPGDHFFMLPRRYFSDSLQRSLRSMLYEGDTEVMIDWLIKDRREEIRLTVIGL